MASLSSSLSSSSSSSSSLLVSSLCRSNLGVLSQKLILIDLLVEKYGRRDRVDESTAAVDPASARFSSVCPVVGASVGQHFRHSTDHIELAALVARSAVGASESEASVGELRYDLRVRGGTLEKDVSLARERVVSVMSVLEELEEAVSSSSSSERSDSASPKGLESVPVVANFLLSGDAKEESPLQSTIGRELGFAAHHAIHHMAMVKIIATTSLGVELHELPPDFGRAPSTVKNDNTND